MTDPKTLERLAKEKLKTYSDAAKALSSAQETMTAAHRSKIYMDKDSKINKKAVVVKAALNVARLAAPTPIAQLLISLAGTAMTPLTMSNILPRPRSMAEAVHESAWEIKKTLEKLNMLL